VKVTGYLHPAYAESLSEFGKLRELPHCGGWILERPIPNSDFYDAMGCYPLFACQDWTELPSDLNSSGKELVSLAIVTDPFGNYDETILRQSFDLVIPFKDHFIVDLKQDPHGFVSKDNRKTVRQIKKAVNVEVCPDPLLYADQWLELYAFLIQRHHITGIRAFSRESLEKQLAVPGMVMMKAESKGEIIGMYLWYVQGNIAYSHLSASNALGYELQASYSLVWFSLQYFAGKVQWLNLGGGVGTHSNGKDGLSMFKRGWATGTRTAYFCGKILDPERYTEIANARGLTTVDYFPAYRKGEFQPTLNRV
jgi:hypothetical protein